MIILSEKEFYSDKELIEELCSNNNGKLESGFAQGETVMMLSFSSEIEEDCFWGDYSCALQNNYLI